MVRYHNFDVVFAEIPGETTLALNITGCPNRCPGCHSPPLQADDGRVLDGGLAYRGLTRGWLTRELSSRGYRSPSEVLLLTIDDAGKILCIGKEWAK